MKEAYFTASSLAAQAQEFIQAAQPYIRERIQFDPSQAGLLVLDAQAYFFEPGSHAYVPSAPAILPGLRMLIAAFNAKGRPVIFTKHSNDRQNAGMMGVWWKDLIQNGSAESEIIGGLKTHGSIEISKTQYDAFYSSDLELKIKEKEIKQLVIGGVMTHLCCETTARAAFTRGYQVFFLVDATATYNQDLHRSSIINLAHGFALPVTVNSLLQIMDAA